MAKMESGVLTLTFRQRLEMGRILSDLSNDEIALLDTIPMDHLRSAIEKEALLRKESGSLEKEQRIQFDILCGDHNMSSSLARLIIEFTSPFHWDEQVKPDNVDMETPYRCRVTSVPRNWQHCVGREGGQYLEFSVHLNEIGNSRTSNDLCIGVITKPITANRAGGGYDGNGRVIAHGNEWFAGHCRSNSYQRLQGGVAGRWKTGDTVRVIADAVTSTISYQWGTDPVHQHQFEFVPAQGDIYPVVCVCGTVATHSPLYKTAHPSLCLIIPKHISTTVSSLEAHPLETSHLPRIFVEHVLFRGSTIQAT